MYAIPKILYRCASISVSRHHEHLIEYFYYFFNGFVIKLSNGLLLIGHKIPITYALKRCILVPNENAPVYSCTLCWNIKKIVLNCPLTILGQFNIKK